MPLAVVCDLAEGLMRARMEVGDMLSILVQLGGGKADDYEPPAERIADMLDDPGFGDLTGGSRRARDPATRAAQVAAFIAATGGDG